MAPHKYDSPNYVRNIHQIYMATFCSLLFSCLLKALSFFVWEEKSSA